MKPFKLKDLTISITDGKHGDCENQKDSGFYFISCKDVYDGRIHYENARQITEEDFYETHKRTQLEPNDILVTNSGTIGRMALVKDIPETRHTTFQKSVAIVKPNEKVVRPAYLYYALLCSIQQLVDQSNGAAQKNLLLGTMREFSLSIEPDLDRQGNIARTVSVYDDLIENNQKQIKLLEEAAQRLYKEWFIDLRFPGHESTPIVNGLPEGWTEKHAENFFEMTIGKTPPRAEVKWFLPGDSGIPWVSITDMGSSGAYILKTDESLSSEAITSHNVKVIPKGTILLSFKLTVGRVSITTKAMCTNEAIAHFRVDDETRGYTYLYLKDFEYEKLGNTSAISKAVNSKIVKAMPFIMPDNKTLASFAAIVNPLLNEIYNRQYQNLQLVEARDRLLPKLVSGELEV